MRKKGCFFVSSPAPRRGAEVDAKSEKNKEANNNKKGGENDTPPMSPLSPYWSNSEGEPPPRQ